MLASVNQVTQPNQLAQNNIAQPQPSFDDQSSIKRQTETLSNDPLS
jgi:hypothetical protein